MDKVKGILFKIICFIAILIWIFIGLVFLAWVYVKPIEETRGAIALIVICIIIGVLKGILKALPHP